MFNPFKKRSKKTYSPSTSVHRKEALVSNMRELKDFLPSFGMFGLSSADKQNTDSDMLRARARNLVKTNDFANKYVTIMATNVIGEKGIRLEPDYYSTRGQQNTVLNTAVKDVIKKWGKKGSCTIDGRLAWVEVQHLIIKTILQDGEVLIHIVKSPAAKYGIALNVIDIDYLVDKNKLKVNPKNKNEIKSGVELDSYGKPVAYWLYDRHPSEGPSGAYHRILAEEMIHAYVSDRAGQTRGLTKFHSVVSTLEWNDKYTQSCMEAVDIANRKMFSITSKSKETDEIMALERQRQIELDKAGLTDEEPNQAPVYPSSPRGSILSLADTSKGFEVASDVEVKTMDWQYPNTSFSEFHKSILKRISSGLDLSYYKISSDKDGASYSNLKETATEDRETFKLYQAWMIVNICQPIFEALIDHFAGNLIKAPKVDGSYEYLKEVKWIPRGFPLTDPTKEINAYIMAILYGLDSRSNILATMGVDIEDVFSEMQRDNNLEKEYGLNFPKNLISSIQQLQPQQEEDKTEE